MEISDGPMASRRWTLKDIYEISRRAGEKDLPQGFVQEAMSARQRIFDPLGIRTPPQPEKPKYRNKATEYNGRKYGSKLEAFLAQQLDLEWKAGNLLWYTTQVPFVLEGGVVYRADFLVVRAPSGWDEPIVIQVIDSTGVMTQAKRNKLKQMDDRYGIVVLIHRKAAGLVPYHQVPVGRPRRASAPSPG